MSDIQELIYKVSMDCIEKGQRMERDRIIRLLEQKAEALSRIESGHFKGSELMSVRTKTIESAIALIRGENNDSNNNQSA